MAVDVKKRLSNEPGVGRYRSQPSGAFNNFEDQTNPYSQLYGALGENLFTGMRSTLRGGTGPGVQSGTRDGGPQPPGSGYDRKPPGYAQKPIKKKPWRPGSKPWDVQPIIPWNPYTPGHPDQEGHAPGYGQWGHSDPGDEDPTYDIRPPQKPLTINTGPFALPKDELLESPNLPGDFGNEMEIQPGSLPGPYEEPGEFTGGGPGGYQKGGGLGDPDLGMPPGYGSFFGVINPIPKAQPGNLYGIKDDMSSLPPQAYDPKMGTPPPGLGDYTPPTRLEFDSEYRKDLRCKPGDPFCI